MQPKCNQLPFINEKAMRADCVTAAHSAGSAEGTCRLCPLIVSSEKTSGMVLPCKVDHTSVRDLHISKSFSTIILLDASQKKKKRAMGLEYIEKHFHRARQPWVISLLCVVHCFLHRFVSSHNLLPPISHDITIFLQFLKKKKRKKAFYHFELWLSLNVVMNGTSTTAVPFWAQSCT